MVLDLQRSTAVRNLIGVEDCRFNSAMDLLEKGPSPDQEVDADSEGFCTPVPIEFVHPFRSFCTPGEVVTPALA